jgi:putative drug exporter of the RND superfamily
MLARLARFAIRRRRTVITGWVLLLVVGFAVGGSVFGRLETQGLAPPENAESLSTSRRLVDGSEARGPRVVGVYDGVAADDPVFTAEVRRAVAELAAVPGVGRVLDHVSTPSPELRATDGRAVALVVEMKPLHQPGAQGRVESVLRSVRAPTVLMTGDDLVDDEFGTQAEEDLQRAELLTLPILLVLLVVLFGGVVAAGLPLLVAVSGLAGTLLVLLGLSELGEVSVFAVNVASMLGLGLAVDYGLLVVSRFREERRTAGPALAIERTMVTAGRTIVFSGLTVAVSMAALLVFDDVFLRSMAAGGIAVVLVALVAAVTLLPALLMSGSRWIRPARARLRGGNAVDDDTGFFARLSGVVQRRAVPIVAVVAVGLAALGMPFLRAHFEEPDARFLPTSSDSRRVADLMDARFPASTRTDPIVVVADVDRGSPAFAAYVGRLRGLPGVLSVAVGEGHAAAGESLRPGHAGRPAVARVVPEGRTQGRTATGLVATIRNLDAPFPTAVAGEAAELVDTERAVVARLPLSLGLLAAATLVLLFLLTGSVVVPVKALLMNVLSLGATFGSLVWVFQDGNLAGLLGVDQAGALDIATPLLIFATAFGLSMDYEVFLLSRIREAYIETGDNDRAVAVGLQRTGRIVTSAAVLVVVVFLGFMAGGFLSVKQAGLGLGLAVLLDATVVRMLLVPATMKLLGGWNWWAPEPLRRFHERWGGWETPRPSLHGQAVGTGRQPISVQ